MLIDIRERMNSTLIAVAAAVDKHVCRDLIARYGRACWLEHDLYCGYADGTATKRLSQRLVNLDGAIMQHTNCEYAADQ